MPHLHGTGMKDQSLTDTFAIALAPEIENGMIYQLYQVVGIEVRLWAYAVTTMEGIPTWLCYSVQVWKVGLTTDIHALRRTARALAEEQGASFVDVTRNGHRPPGRFGERVDITNDRVLDLLRSSATRRNAQGLGIENPI